MILDDGGTPTQIGTTIKPSTKQILIPRRVPIHPLICLRSQGDFTQNDKMRLVMGHIIVVAFILLIAGLTFSFYRKIKKFPIKERAPKLAILQSISFGGVLVTVYIVEVLMLLGMDWDYDSLGEIPFSRKMFKSVFATFRVMSYVVYTFR